MGCKKLQLEEFVLNQELFNTHDHQEGYKQDWENKDYTDFLTGYARCDMVTSGFLSKTEYFENDKEKIFKQWEFFRTTGYGQGTQMACQEVCNLDFSLENADNITQKLNYISKTMTPKGKQFPNVWLNMCWAWTLNPVQMQRNLAEWLSAVPHNKIFAFGVDTGTPFLISGFAKQARLGIGKSLQNLVDNGFYDIKTAESVAQRIMYKNAQELYSV